jgi:hypothetical protein
MIPALPFTTWSSLAGEILLLRYNKCNNVACLFCVLWISNFLILGFEESEPSTFLRGGASPPYLSPFITNKRPNMPKMTAFVSYCSRCSPTCPQQIQISFIFILAWEAFSRSNYDDNGGESSKGR